MSLLERIGYLREYSRHVPFGDVRRMERLMGAAVGRESVRVAERNGATPGSVGDESGELVELRLKSLGRSVFLREDETDVLVLHEIFLRDEYAFVDDHLATPPQYVLDVGANVGLASLWFLDRYPEAVSFAVEPDFGSFALALTNLRQEIATDRCRAVQAAAWSTDGEVALDTRSRAAWSLRCRTPTNGEPTIPALSMSTLIERSGFPRVDLVKIDIEGGEEELFNGPLDWVDQVGCIVCERHGDLTHDWFASRLSHHGFSSVELTSHMSVGHRQ